MPAHPWKSAPLLLTILALLCTTARIEAQPPQQPRVELANKGELARQWKEVRAKYPLVAAAYLESIELQVEAVAKLRVVSLCELPAFANSRLCRDGGRTLPPPEVCRRCRPSSGLEDLERYLSCLEERIKCLS